jgi:hypothetical protein
MKMKTVLNFRKYLLGLIAALIVAAGMLPLSAQAQAEPAFGGCAEDKSTNLLAGQKHDAGDIIVNNDEQNLYITYVKQNGWSLSETYLHVAANKADIPQGAKGNPQIGKFAMKGVHNADESSVTYTVPVGLLNLVDKTAFIAAHASVVSSSGANEGAWAEGPKMADKGSWAMYFTYVLQDCTPVVVTTVATQTEGAFARSSSDAICFLNIDSATGAVYDNPTKDTFNRWGWSNGPLAEGTYTFELWAAAGQCDITKGENVGTVTVDYFGGKAIVTFETTGTNAVTNAPYTLVQAHLYVGTEIVARNDNTNACEGGCLTVAPGQYTKKIDNLATTEETFIVKNLSGPIYVVAHASVDGFPVEE